MPRCKNCKKNYVRQYTMQVACSIKCALELKNDKDELRKAERREFQVYKKSVNEKHMTHGDYEGLLQTEINKIVRLIDYGQPCISCGCKISTVGHSQTGKAAASHYHSVGSNNSLRFNLKNNFQSCYKCNNYLSGNIIGYDKGLTELFGEEFMNYVKTGIVKEYPLIKLSIPELKEKIVIAREIVRELKSVGLVYSKEERIELRREYDARIGIYT